MFHLRPILLTLLLTMPLKLHAEGAVRVMTLNIYGWSTMPAGAEDYAALVREQEVTVLGIQEGVDDWQIEGLPVDYSRAEILQAALGECWDRQYQVYVNRCAGARIEWHERFDLTDGPNAVRTGEIAEIVTGAGSFTLVNVHWDHESATAREASAGETRTVVEPVIDAGRPVIVLGDFNAPCRSVPLDLMARPVRLELVVDAGIDCLFARPSGHIKGWVVEAPPSDHPGIVGELTITGD